jgi:5-hydroxyisourate hydrolase
VSTVSTHVLDTATGTPAAGIPVWLRTRSGEDVAKAVTDADGRCPDLGPERLDAGDYRLVFDTASYLGEHAFFPEVSITFRVSDPDSHYHVPLLLSPFALSSYRGS